MPNGRNRLNLEIEMSSANVKQITDVAPIETFAVGFVDGEGNKATRIVFRIKGTRQFYFLLPKGSEKGMTTASEWFQQQLEERIGDGAQKSNEPIPVKTLPSNIPTGDPMA